jgi:hypothetical protein
MRLPARPTIYEINTAVWLSRLGGESGPLTLDRVPGAAWDALAALPVDAVWLMGVWERSPAGIAIALANDAIMAGNRAALADLQSADVIGSPYCVRDYTVDARFGGTAALQAARDELAARGIGLMLDYVPNHVAADHPWTVAHPERFVRGDEADLAAHPEGFLRVGESVIANGRDPYFAPWPDVVQLDAYSPQLRDAVAATLIEIGGLCDGLRCDMAMLMTNAVFERTWGERVGPAPAEDYWPQLIARVRASHPDLLFMAEVYWDMEWDLQQQGFDLCYDKRLYDRLVAGDVAGVRAHLTAGADYQERLLRFIENHDEPRAAEVFAPPERHRAAAVAFSTLQGARLYHDGQLTGAHIHIPVFLGRGPDEAPDASLEAFYRRLIAAVAGSGLRGAEWAQCECSGWPQDRSCEQLLAWCWAGGTARHLAVINLAAAPAHARVRLPWQGLAGRAWQLTDLLSGATFERDGGELAAQGLYVGLDAWGVHLLEFA